MNVLKKVPFNMRDHKIEVRLLDESWQVYYKKIVGVGDKKGLKELSHDLHNNGIIKHKEGTSWFD